MQKVKCFAVIALLFLCGCQGDYSFSWRDDTPHQNQLLFRTPNGSTYAVSLAPHADAQALIAANTALGNALILDAAFQQMQTQQAARRDWLRLVQFALVVIGAVFIALGAWKMYLTERRKK